MKMCRGSCVAQITKKGTPQSLASQDLPYFDAKKEIQPKDNISIRVQGQFLKNVRGVLCYQNLKKRNSPKFGVTKFTTY